MYKRISFFFLVLSFLALNSFAQDGSGYDTSGLSGGEDDGVNTYLQQAIQQDNTLKTQAEIFNGTISGVYEGSVLSCPYAFERDLFVGSKGEDVRLLQIILNSDKRTIIAVDGPGSPGQETTIFGEGTRTALKKFQALFYDEWIKVADGKFNPRTRTIINAICNGQNKPSNSPNIEARQNRNIYDNIFSVQAGAVRGGIVTTTKGVDSTPPRISLSANISSVKLGDNFKVVINASKEIVPITPDSIIVDGGSVKEIRKLSKVSYTATININEDAKKVLVQIEADKVEDLNGVKNENASNEISVKVLAMAKPIGEDIAGATKDDGLNGLLDKIISSAPTCTYSPTGLLLRVDTAGKTLNTTGCAETQTQNLANQTKTCPNGQTVPATQQCPEQVICNTQQSPFGSSQQCQTASQAQQQAQAQQNQQLGQLLGGLLGKNGFGGGDKSAPGQGNPSGQPGNIFNQPGGLPPGLPSTAPAPTADQLKAAQKVLADPNTSKEEKDEAQRTIDADNTRNTQSIAQTDTLIKQEKDKLAAIKDDNPNADKLREESTQKITNLEDQKKVLEYQQANKEMQEYNQKYAAAGCNFDSTLPNCAQIKTNMDKKNAELAGKGIGDTCSKLDGMSSSDLAKNSTKVTQAECKKIKDAAYKKDEKNKIVSVGSCAFYCAVKGTTKNTLYSGSKVVEISAKKPNDLGSIFYFSTDAADAKTIFKEGAVDIKVSGLSKIVNKCFVDSTPASLKDLSGKMKFIPFSDGAKCYPATTDPKKIADFAKQCENSKESKSKPAIPFNNLTDKITLGC